MNAKWLFSFCRVHNSLRFLLDWLFYCFLNFVTLAFRDINVNVPIVFSLLYLSNNSKKKWMCLFCVTFSLFLDMHKKHNQRKTYTNTNTGYVNVMFFSHFNYVETKEEEERRIKKSGKWKGV